MRIIKSTSLINKKARGICFPRALTLIAIFILFLYYSLIEDTIFVILNPYQIHSACQRKNYKKRMILPDATS